jgi:hypothetical protein
VQLRSRVLNWVTTPIRPRAPGGSAWTSTPSTVTRPAVGTTLVVHIPTVVVFPAPFGPRRPKISPRATSRSMLFTASTAGGPA